MSEELDGVGVGVGVKEGTETAVVEGVAVVEGTLTICTVRVDVGASAARANGARAAEAMRRALLNSIVTGVVQVGAMVCLF